MNREEYDYLGTVITELVGCKAIAVEKARQAAYNLKPLLNFFIALVVVQSIFIGLFIYGVLFYKG